MKPSKTEFSLRLLSKPRLAVFIRALALDWALVLLPMYVFSLFPNPFTFLLASLVIALAQHGLAVLGHEGVHYCISGNRKLGDWMGRIFCFFPVGLTISSYRIFHNNHHRFLGQEQDPERPLLKKFGKYWVPPFNLPRAAKLWGAGFFGGNLRELMLFVKEVPTGSLIERAQMIIFWGVVLALTAKFHGLVYVGLWFFSLATTYWGVFRLRGWIEHDLERKDSSRFALPGPLWRIVFPHNIWMHYEHHKYPTVPFYNLHKIRQADTATPIARFTTLLKSFHTEEEQPTRELAS